MYPIKILTIVVDRATNLSYPNRRIIAVTNGTKQSTLGSFQLMMQ